jgi:hypothetical protein
MELKWRSKMNFFCIISIIREKQESESSGRCNHSGGQYERAKKFDADKPGFKPDETVPTSEEIYKCGGFSFMQYESQFAGTAKNTAMTLQTENLERDLRKHSQQPRAIRVFE